MKRFLPLLALAGLVVAACNETPTEPAAAESAVAMFDESVTGTPVGSTNSVTPSTNEYNEANGWAHAVYVDVVVGQVTLRFVSTQTWISCFEWRIDDEAPTIGGPHYNPDITDGLWTFACVGNSSSDIPLTADQYVDIRMVFGDEGHTDERFDWTRFYVLTKDACQAGDWEALGFRNQGQCVRYVETGRDSRAGD